ncbi:hypothetical protein SADUNF_Sadunf14G0001500 [Salix dunnii]|uniref:R13L1/DRL21-like LRR repeat region domain-containing protein n=1 Tax=Salix dunnii TaxID=1413687 RepID=A0A835MLM3_9ROSI|nr:hypothetical protein SADUNF_Sadunf14G0001500 [Salix dunnii]
MVAVSNRGLQNKMKARIPTHFQGQFGQEKFVPADPPDMLNYEGCELLLISASDGIGEGWEWSSRQNVKAMMIQLLVLIRSLMLAKQNRQLNSMKNSGKKTWDFDGAVHKCGRLVQCPVSKQKNKPAELRFLTRLQTLSIFVLGPNHMVEELKCLNELRGVLKIIKLEEVRDKEEAEKAKLREKRMNELVLKWSDEGNSSVNNEGALEGPQPHPYIRSLAIEGYGGENFPSWMSTLQLNNLMVLRLEGCSKSRQLPTLGCLPRINILEMRGMGSVKCIGNEFCCRSGRAGVLFPALKELSVLCGMLKSILICGLSSLVAFEIEDCDELRFFSGEFDGFKSLQLLRIWGCEKLASIPSVQHYTTLVELNIDDFPELITIPSDFRELKYSLKKLIASSLKLGALPSGLQCCTSLEELSITSMRKRVPQQLQHLTALKSLARRNFDGEELEEALPDCLANLSSLR